MGLNEQQLKQLIMTHAKKKNLIKSATIELLDYCNFHCPHCYVHNQYMNKMDINLYKKIIDELADIKCIWLLLTGGEVTLHPNFIEMYEYAYDKGLLITIFTNGFSINADIIDLFRKKPPYEIEITLYGYNAETYYKFTKIKNSYSKVMKNIDSLIEIKSKLKLKTVVVKPLLKYLDKIKSIATSKNIEFRQDGILVPTINGNCNVYNFRVSAKTLAFLDKNDANIIYEKNKGKILGDELYTCDAGNNSIFIDAGAKMYICMMSRIDFYDLSKNKSTIKEGQQILLKNKESKPKLTFKNKCFRCKHRMFCRYCPGIFKLATGSEYKHIPYYCRYSKEMNNYVEENNG